MLRTHRARTRALGLLLVVMLAGAGTVLPTTAMQANGNTYVSTTTGQTIAWNAPWSYDSQGSTTTAGSEVIVLTSNIAATLIGFLPTGIDMNQARDQVLAEFQKNAASFQTLDRGSYGNVSYSLDLAELTSSSSNQTVPFGVFTLFLGNRGNGATEVDLFLAPVVAFTQGMTSAKQSITVGGAAIFAGVAPGGLQTLLDRNVPSGGKTSSNQPSNQNANNTTSTTRTTTPAPTQAPTKAGSGGLDTNGLHLGGSETTTTPTKATATKSAGSTTTSNQGSVDSALKKLGVTAPGKYTSPQFGAAVTWNASWAIAVDKQNKPVVMSDASHGTDALMLDCKVGDGFVFFTIVSASQGTPAQYEQSWRSTTYFQKAGLVNAEVLDSSSTDSDAFVLIRHDASATNAAKLIELMQAHVTNDGSALVLTSAVVALNNNIPDFFTAMASGLKVDGKAPMSTADAVRFVTEAAS